MISTNIKNLHSNFCTSLHVEICHSPYCQSYNSYNVNSENLVLDQLIIPKFIFIFILITCLLDVVLIL